MFVSDEAVPTPQEQLKFLKHIQQILQSGTFTSTYKFALLIFGISCWMKVQFVITLEL